MPTLFFMPFESDSMVFFPAGNDFRIIDQYLFIP